MMTPRSSNAKCLAGSWNGEFKMGFSMRSAASVTVVLAFLVAGGISPGCRRSYASPIRVVAITVTSSDVVYG